MASLHPINFTQLLLHYFIKLPSFLGDQLSLDVCSVWNDNKFLKYSISLMGYGFFGDVIKNSEQLRWLGPRRYDLAGFRSFMENRCVLSHCSAVN